MQKLPVDEFGHDLLWHTFGQIEEGEVRVMKNIASTPPSQIRQQLNRHYKVANDLTEAQKKFLIEQLDDETSWYILLSYLLKVPNVSGAYIELDDNCIWGTGQTLAECRISGMNAWFRAGRSADDPAANKIACLPCTDNAYFSANNFGNEEFSNLTVVDGRVIHEDDRKYHIALVRALKTGEYKKNFR